MGLHLAVVSLSLSRVKWLAREAVSISQLVEPVDSTSDVDDRRRARGPARIPTVASFYPPPLLPRPLPSTLYILHFSVRDLRRREFARWRNWGQLFPGRTVAGDGRSIP